MKGKLFSKRKIGTGLVIALFLFIWAINASVNSRAQETIDPRGNLIAQHDRTSPRYNKNCVSCHSKILTEKSLDPSVSNVHVAMLPYVPGNKNDTKCVWCHRTVDLVPDASRVEKSKGNLRKMVNTTLCTLCHGPSGPAKQFYQSELPPTQPDGVQLYELVCAACHRELANSQMKGKAGSKIQKAVDENKGGMGPLSILTAEEIQAIANALAQ